MSNPLTFYVRYCFAKKSPEREKEETHSHEICRAFSHMKCVIQKKIENFVPLGMTVQI